MSLRARSTGEIVRPNGVGVNNISQIHTLQDLVRGLAAFGEIPAVISFAGAGKQEMTFGELENRVMRLTGGLLAKGIGRGDVVAIFAPNQPSWMVASLALVASGATLLLLDDLLSEDELARAIGGAGCGTIFTSRDHVPALRRVADDELEIFVLDEGAEAPEGAWTLETLMGERPAALPDLSPDDVVTLHYTSGTTGAPKGVPLTHANIVSNLTALLSERLVSPGDPILLPLPLHHSYPFIVGMLIPLASGATVVLPSGVSGPEIAQALHQGAVKGMVGVPRLYEAIYAGIEARVRASGRAPAAIFRATLALSVLVRRRFGLRLGRVLFGRLHRQFAPALSLLACGGARLDPEIGWRLEGLGWEVLNGYGLVETASIATFNARGRTRMDSVGLPAPGVEVRIDQPDAEGCGEVLLRGPNVFAGYRDDPEANRMAFTGDGWFRTGDLGVVDAEGYLYIVGRVKEMIVLSDGKNIAPEEVEAVYGESPYVREVAVLERDGALVGLATPELDAVRRAGSGRIEDLIRVTFAELSQRLVSYKRISGFAITRETLPRTHLGKYRRHLLPEIFARARRGEGPPPAPLSAEDRALLDGPRGKMVWRWLEGRFPDAGLSLDTCPQLDLGVDSLAWVELGMEMEHQLGLVLSEEAIARSVTLSDLLREVETGAGGQERPSDRRTVERERIMADKERWLAPVGPGLKFLHLILYGTGWLLARVLFRLRVTGLQRVPRSGPLIVAANHASDLDPFIMAAALTYGHLGKTYWGADAGRVFRTPLRRALCRAAHLFPVDDRAPVASLAMAADVLRRGGILIWFPEEWRSPTGELQRFLPGVGKLLKESGAPAVPASIGGTFEAMPRSRRLPRPTPVTVLFGDPVSASDLEAKGAGANAPERIANALHDAVAGLASPLTNGGAP